MVKEMKKNSARALTSVMNIEKICPKSKRSTLVSNWKMDINSLPNSKRSTHACTRDYLKNLASCKRSTRVLTSVIDTEKICSKSKRSQAGVEYMIVVGFITFAVLSILSLSYFYSEVAKSKIRMNQIESFANQLTNSAESVFFAGEPSKVSVSLYLPDGVRRIIIDNNEVIVYAGKDVRSFRSRVPLQGNISSVEGIKSLSIEAKLDYVLIS